MSAATKRMILGYIRFRELGRAQAISASVFFGLDPGLFLDEKVDAAEIEEMYHRNT